MNISFNILKKFIKLKENMNQVQHLLEDVGLEVKKVEKSDKDHLLAIELLANRGDHHYYEGIAREISGRTGDSVNVMPSISIEPSLNSDLFNIDTGGCIAFSLTEYKKDSCLPFNQLDSEYTYMLEVGGVNSICPVIDVTNVVNLELGQPAHVYDADKIKGKITVRESKAGEVARLLFQKGEIVLPEGIMVIADDKNILSIAGVIGCDIASVDSNTSRVLLEAALFDPVRIRKASQKLGIQTLATTRFERGGDLSAIQKAIYRTSFLYEQIGWKNDIGFSFKQKIELETRNINLDIDKVSEYLDYKLDSEEIIDRLGRYGFKVQKNDNPLIFSVPMSRIWDVEHPVDLYEELGRSIGYNSLKSEVPKANIELRDNSKEDAKSSIDNYLVSQGFFEIFTDSIYSREHIERMCLDDNDELSNHVSITNAHDKGYSLLKNNCLIQAVELVEKNLRLKNRDIKAYEWTRIFTPDNLSVNGVCKENKTLWGVVNGTALPTHYSYKNVKVTPLYLKGLAEGVSDVLDIGLKTDTNIDETQQPLAKLLHPYRRLRILTPLGEPIGLLGEVHPKILFAFGIKTDKPCYFELDSDILLTLPRIGKFYSSPSELMPINRDICLQVPNSYPAGEIMEDIKNNQEYPVSKVTLTDIYQENPDSPRNITYSIDYQAEDKKTFTAKEVNLWTQEIMELIEKRIQEKDNKAKIEE